MSPAATSAARKPRPAGTSRSKAQAAAAPRRARRTSGPARPHRRVSGPVAAAAPARTVPVPSLPRLPKLRPIPGLAGLGGRALEVGRGLPDSSFLNRLIRSRTWIGVLGFLLIGLVALNVALLKLNNTAGREASVASALRIQNAELRGRVARLSTTERIQEEG